LEQIVDLYNQIPTEFNDAFSKMHQIGKPEVRKYCSPLEALFWIVEDEKLEDLHSLIHNYSLHELLHEAWGIAPGKNKYTFDLSKQQLKGIIDSLGERESIIYEGNMKPHIIKRVMLIRYNENSHRFPKESRELINRSRKVSKDYMRWKDFNIVVDRLNAPYLVHYYIKHSFEYRHGRNKTPYWTFKCKGGQCISVANFGVYLLKRAGYNTFVRSVDFAGFPRGSDHTGSGIITEDGKYLLVVNFGLYGNWMSGPHDLNYLDFRLAHGREIIDRRWGHKRIMDDFNS